MRPYLIKFAALCVIICSTVGDQSNNALNGSLQPNIPKLPDDTDFQTFTTIKKQWKCANGDCEETITKCHNDKCETSKNYFKSEHNQPIDGIDLGVNKLPENFVWQTFTSVRKQWKCVNGDCEEIITKCHNDKCETTKNYFKSEKNQPEVQKFEIPVPSNVAETPKLPPNDVKHPNINKGMIDVMAHSYNYTYSWSNSKHVDKQCLNKICTVTTTTCSNGRCEEKAVIVPL